MSAVVGLLKVSLQAETAELTRGFADAEKRGERFAKQIEGVGRAAAAGLAAAGAAVIAMTMRTAAAGDELNKLSARVGVSVESLSRLKYAAEQNDTSISVLQNGMQRLSRSMADAQNQSSASAKAFDAIGVSTTNADGSLRGIDGVLLDVADAFAKSGDAAAKAALAQQLFGRAGMELLPFLQNGKSGLQDLGDEAERLGVTFTSEAAQAATLFQDNLTRLNAVSTGIAYEIGNAVIPTITRFADELLAASAAGLGLLDAITRLGTANPGLSAEQHVERVRAEMEAAVAAAERQGASDAFRAQRMRELEMLAKELAYYQSLIPAVKESGGARKEESDAIAAWVARLQEALAAARAEAAARTASTRAAAEAQRAAKALADERAREVSAAADGLRSIGEQIRAQREYNEEIGLSARAIADLRYNRMQATAAQLDERAATIALFDPNSDLIELYRQQAAALRELADAQRDGTIAQASADAARDAAGEWQRTADSIEQTLTDALMRAFEGGASFADALRQTLINMFKTMVLRPIIAPIAGGMAGMFAGPAGAGSQAWPGAGGGGGGVGGVNPMAFLGGNSIGMTFSNIATWLSTSPMLAGTGVGNAMMGWAGNVAGLSNLGFGLAGLGGGLLGNWLFDGKGYSGLGGSLGGTVGYALGAGSAGMLGSLGWAAGPLGALGGAVLGSFLGSLFGGSGERFPRTVSGTKGYWDSERSRWVSDGDSADQYGRHMPGKRQFGDSMDQALDGLQEQFSIRIAGLLEAFGHDVDLTTGAHVRLRRTSGRLAAGFFGTLGDEEFSMGDHQYGGDAEIESAFEEFVNDVMTKGIAAAVEASPLAQNIKDIFGEGLSVEQSDFALDALISAATGLSDLDRAPAVFQRLESALTDVIEAASFEELSDAAGEFAVLNESMTLFYDAFTSNADKFRDAQNSLLYAFEDLDVAMPRSIDEFYRMADALDLSTEEGRELFNELMALAPAFLTVAGAVEQVFDAISRSTADTIEGFLLDTMSDQEKYAYFDEQIANALLEMAEANDPETIARLYEEANADLKAAWAVLSDDEKQRLRDEFIERAYQLEEEAQARLSVVPAIEESIEAQQQAGLMAERAATVMQSSAELMARMSEQYGDAVGNLAGAISSIPDRIVVESNVIVTEVGR